ncbi:hypothetical protein WICMUC_004878 [Wickerhamomyces mucosus]|uniref:PH domain-containing protein n=1 Tax=Wickerhamomyces mucosus TaxID=1378264 RepID=A0A9P8T983_9ASCO|nr:hypothetical protein WICMUC_004878 [Wickerhamomyces mucosus]
MSRNGTMTSTVSAQAFQQQQQNLQQLHNLEQNFNTNYGQQAKSFSSDTRLIADVLNNNIDAKLHSNSINSNTTNQIATANVNQQSQLLQPVQQQQQQQQQLSQRSIHHPSPSRNISASETIEAHNNYSSQEFRNPLAVNLPLHSNPTDILAGRFSAWRSIITSLVQYLNEIVSIQDEIVRQQMRLSHAVNFPIFNQNTKQSKQQASSAEPQVKEEIYQQNFFLPHGSGSIHDLPGILANYHVASANLASRASKELNSITIPRLEDLKRELLVKIKEIKSLASDFKTKTAKEIAQTKVDLTHYIKSIEDAKFGSQNLQPKNDPYITKILLDKQLKKQLVEENYLLEAFVNLQTSGKELEKVVVIEIQNALTVYAKISAEQAQSVFDKLISQLDAGFLTKQPSVEWDQFIASDKNFIDENLPKRELSQLQYEKDNDPLTYEVRSSFLERRSKFLKSYSRGYYVLTPSFVHEFKSPDRKKDLVPVLSISIDEIEIEEHTGKNTRFVLKKVGKISSHKYVFRTESYDIKNAWCNDIKNLKELSSATSRGAYALKHHNPKPNLSRVSSQRSRPSTSINESIPDNLVQGQQQPILTSQNPRSQNRLSSPLSQQQQQQTQSNQQQYQDKQFQQDGQTPNFRNSIDSYLTNNKNTFGPIIEGSGTSDETDKVSRKETENLGNDYSAAHTQFKTLEISQNYARDH